MKETLRIQTDREFNKNEIKRVNKIVLLLMAFASKQKTGEVKKTCSKQKPYNKEKLKDYNQT